MEDFHSMRTDLRALPVGRNRTMPLDPVTAWPLDRYANTDPRTRRNRSHRDSAILDRQRALRQIEPVVLDRDAERLGQVAGTTTEVVLVDRASNGSAPLAHQFEAVERLQRANQDRAWIAIRFRDGVDQVMDAVIQIDVRDARRSKQRFVAGRTAKGCMAGGIVFTDIRLGLDDDPRYEAFARTMDEHLAQQVL